VRRPPQPPVEQAVRDALADPANHTPDLAGTATTSTLTDAIATRVAELTRQ